MTHFHQPSPFRSRSVIRWISVPLVLLILILSGCQVMYEQPRYDPLEPSDFYADGRSAREIVTGTIPQQALDPSDPLLTGRGNDGEYVAEIPTEVTLDLLERGQERFDINCSPCHGVDGNGQGVAVTFGFPQPPSLHTEKLYQAPPGYIFDVITNGQGLMFPYDYRVKPPDRWAITAYIYALQLSQNTSAEQLNPDEQEQLENQP